MQRKTALLALLILAVPHHALGQEIGADMQEGLRTCAGVADTVQRLTCFDVLTKPLVSNASASSSKTSAPSKGVWRVSTETSPVDDSKNVFVHVSGVTGIQDQYSQSAELTLTIACRENTTSAYIHFGGHFMSDLQGAGRVTYRIDQQPAQTKGFTESTNHESLGLWSGGAAIPWIKSMFGGQKMYVAATPYSENQVSDTLPIEGLEEAIKPLRDACGW